MSKFLLSGFSLLEIGTFQFWSCIIINQLKSTFALFDLHLKELDKSMKLHVKSDEKGDRKKDEKHFSNERSWDTDISRDMI